MVEHSINITMRNDYKLIFESYLKSISEADNADLEQVTDTSGSEAPQQQTPQSQESEQSISQQDFVDIAKDVNAAYDSQMKLLDKLLQKNILDQNSKNELALYANGSLVSLARELTVNASRNNVTQFNNLKNSFNSQIAQQLVIMQQPQQPQTVQAQQTQQQPAPQS